jgi:hypothetical protein
LCAPLGIARRVREKDKAGKEAGKEADFFSQHNEKLQKQGGVKTGRRCVGHSRHQGHGASPM